jgi:hypothetical protein
MRAARIRGLPLIEKGLTLPLFIFESVPVCFSQYRDLIAVGSRVKTVNYVVD